MHSGGFELTKLTYTRLEDKDNLIGHPGDRLFACTCACFQEVDRRDTHSDSDPVLVPCAVLLLLPLLLHLLLLYE